MRLFLVFRRVLFLIILSLNTLYSQKQQQDTITANNYYKIGVSYMIGDSSKFRFVFSPPPGTLVFGGGEANGVALSYLRPLNKKQNLELETGIEYFYTNHSYYIYGADDFSNIDSDDFPNDGLNYPTSEFHISSVPVGIKFNFWRYFFLNTGTVINFDINKKGNHIGDATSLNLLGVAQIGVGFQLDIVSGFTVFINPQARIYDGFIIRNWKFGLTYIINKR